MSAPALTQITDIVYRADGTPAQGTALISWPSFTTAAGQAVAAGTLSVALGANGSFNANLAPNSGASPAGTYYRVIIKLDDGTSDTESWMVPATQTTTIAAIRAKIVPANVAAQFLTRDVADSVYVNVSSNQAVSGIKTFASSPSVPTPQNANDAANKSYVDAQVAKAGVSASGVQLAPTASQSITQPAGTTFSVNYAATEKLNNIRYADQFGGADAGTKINAAIADLPATGGTVDARGFEGAQTFAVPITVNKPVSLLLGAANITNVAFKISGDFSLHSNNRATATLTTAAGGTMFTLSGTVHQFLVEGVTLSGSGSGSQLYISPDYQSGVNDFSMGRFVFDNDIVQYFGAHGVPAITLGRSNYLVSLTRDLFVQNYGCAFVADGAEAFTGVRFTRDWRRLRCLDPEADVTAVELLEEDLGRLLESRTPEIINYRGPMSRREWLLDTIARDWSGTLQLTPAVGVLTEHPQAELGLLAQTYLESATRDRRVQSGRRFIYAAMREAFEKTGVWNMMWKDIAVAQYTATGDPLKIDCAYRPMNEVIHMFHAVSLATAIDSAKVLAFSYQDFREGLAQAENANPNLYAVVEDGLDRGDAQIDFALTTLDRYGIDVATISQMPAVAERARLELRL